MYIVEFNENINGMFIRLNDAIDNPKEVSLQIKNVVRDRLTPGFTSIVDLTNVTVDRLQSHITEVRQALIVFSIKKVGKIIRIGDRDVLELFSKIYDQYYAYKVDAPIVLECSSYKEFVETNPELDSWFTTMLFEHVVILDDFD